MEKVKYLGQPNCFRLSNGTVEVIVTTDIGPRVLRYGFVSGENIFAEVPDLATKTALGEWKPWGGHRLWCAPELMPGSYAPDNEPIAHQVEGEAIRLQQPTDKAGIQKTIRVQLAKSGTQVTLWHQLINRNLWPIRVAPWTSTIMRGGGMTVLPQEPYRSHEQCLAPAQPIVTWYFTRLADPRWRIGDRYLCLSTDEQRAEPQKVGIANKQRWCGYHCGTTLFIKRFAYIEGVEYPDFGCNNETYTTRAYMEVESLGPLQTLEPGEAVDHVEDWFLFREVNIGKDEASLAAAIDPLVAQVPPT